MKHISIIFILLFCVGCSRTEHSLDAVLKEVRDTNYPFMFLRPKGVPILAKPGIPRLVTFVYDLYNKSDVPLSVQPNFIAVLDKKSTRPTVEMENGFHPISPNETGKMLLTLDEKCMRELELNWEEFETLKLMKEMEVRYELGSSFGGKVQDAIADIVYFSEDSVVYLVGNLNAKR